VRGIEADGISTRGRVIGRAVGGGGSPVTGSKSTVMCLEGFDFFLVVGQIHVNNLRQSHQVVLSNLKDEGGFGRTFE
jgi:hypothetical protein